MTIEQIKQYILDNKKPLIIGALAMAVVRALIR